jgi:hypothetical protein
MWGREIEAFALFLHTVGRTAEIQKLMSEVCAGCIPNDPTCDESKGKVFPVL